MGWDDQGYRMGLLYVSSKRGMVASMVYVLWMTIRGKDIERWKQDFEWKIIA